MPLPALRWAFVLLGCAWLAAAKGQVAGILLGAGYFSPEPRTGYAHDEQLCPEFGLSIGVKAGRSRLGLAVIHSTRSTSDRMETVPPSTNLLQEDQQTRSVTTELYALFPISKGEKRVHYMAGPALDLVFPYRTDVQRTFSDMPPQDEPDAFVNYTPPGLKAGLRFRTEWRIDVQWTLFGDLGANYTLRQTFTEISDHFNSYLSVTPPTDRMDYHLWLGVSIALGGEDCDCPAFH